MLFRSFQQREAIAVGQPEIKQHEVWLRFETLERLSGRTGLENRVAIRTKTFPNRPPDECFVVDEKDCRVCHGSAGGPDALRAAESCHYIPW